jgi:hypothetical protein
MSNHRDDAGTICMENGVVKYSSPAPRLGEWELAIDEVVAIGEFTSEEGPFWFDWYISFVRPDGWWFDAPANAAGMDDVLKELETILGCKLNCSLFASATFASRIMYPARLVEQPLFAWKPRPRSFWQFWRACQVLQELSGEAMRTVRAELDGTAD